jgi:hypothetical protein
MTKPSATSDSSAVSQAERRGNGPGGLEGMAVIAGFLFAS